MLHRCGDSPHANAFEYGSSRFAASSFTSEPFFYYKPIYECGPDVFTTNQCN
jgi:hypothetical protein